MPKLIWCGMGQLLFAFNPRSPLREEQPVLKQHCCRRQFFARDLASSPPKKKPISVGGFIADETNALGCVLDVLCGTFNREKLKRPFAQNSQNRRCASFLVPAWDSGAAPCFHFDETAEKDVWARQLASSLP